MTDPLEIAIQQMGQLKRITSISQPGLSIIRPEMNDKYDKSTLPQVWDELRRKVGDAQSQLPPGCSASIVHDDFGDVYGVFFCLYGDGYSYAELLEYAKLLRRELLLVKNVGKIDLFGERQEAVYLEVSRARLAQLQISPDTITASISGQNQVTPAGRVEIDDQFVRIHPSGEFGSLEDLGNLLIRQDNALHTKLYLRDIATVRRGYVEPPIRIMRFNGRQGIGLGISTVSGGNVVTMGEALKTRLRELQPLLPVGVELGVVSFEADSVTKAINHFVDSLIQAVAIVIVALMISMGLRSGMIIGGVLLITIFGTFVIMKANGVHLERISLGALIIALGLATDNAIVVVEGILVGIQRGQDAIKAAASIVQQTMWPLLVATVVAILAFAPIGLSQDSTGEFCRSLFQVILYCLLLSWLLAITVTPLLGVMFLKARAKKKGETEKDPYQTGFFRIYRSFLEGCIRLRVLTVLVLIGMLVLAIFGFRFVTKSFFPPSPRPQFMVHYWLPQGTRIERTESDAAKLENYLLGLDGVESVSTFVGAGALRFILTYTPEEPNSAYALLIVSVDDYRKSPALIAKLERFASENLPDAQMLCRRFMLGPGDPNRIQVRFRGPDTEVLRKLAEETKQVLRAEPQVVDIMDDWRQRVPVLRPIINEGAARNNGLTRTQIASAIQQAFQGQHVGVYREKDLLLPIISRAPEAERNDVWNLQDVRIWSPAAQRSIPLGQVVSANEMISDNDIIRRRDRLPTITVKCDPARGEASPVFELIRPRVEQRFADLKREMRLKEYSMEWGGEYENTRDSQNGLKANMPPILIAMILLIVVLFNSIRQPLAIFLVVPTAIIGLTIGLLATGQPFGFMALLGFLSLSGMLIKNAIVLIDEVNSNLALGKPPYTAVVEAGVSRMRPVVNTAGTTVLGMIPLLLDPFYAAMAVAIMAGLTFGALLTLIMVPVLYMILFRIPSPASSGPDDSQETGANSLRNPLSLSFLISLWLK